MIIGACGFGSTGSSAVTDYVKEFGVINVIDSFEFTWVSAVDGLIDLDFHLNHPHGRTRDSIAAIQRYVELCEKVAKKLSGKGVDEAFFMNSVNGFIGSIITTSWKWYGVEPSTRPWWDRLCRYFIKRTNIVTKWEVKNGRQWEKYPYEDVHLSVYPDNFDSKAKQHVMEIIDALRGDDRRDIIMDQPFPGNNPQSCFKFFDDPYAIVVDRDPRDNYVFARTKLLTKPFSHLMPTNSVVDFVKYYKAIRDKQPYKENNPRILRIQFEDMVYHYDETTKLIRDFLHLPENPHPKAIFDPAVSMPNTQVWKRFPQFADDIKYIEESLPEYLFDYTGCPEPDPKGKMFVGKSPKSRN
jgi:hypothetical protein